MPLKNSAPKCRPRHRPRRQNNPGIPTQPTNRTNLHEGEREISRDRFTGSASRHYRRRLLFAETFISVPEVWKVVSQDRRRQKGGIYRTRFTNRQGSDGHSRWHLYNAEK